MGFYKNLAIELEMCDLDTDYWEYTYFKDHQLPAEPDLTPLKGFAFILP